MRKGGLVVGLSFGIRIYGHPFDHTSKGRLVGKKANCEDAIVIIKGSLARDNSIRGEDSIESIYTIEIKESMLRLYYEILAS